MTTPISTEKPALTEVTTTVVNALTPFDSNERKRIITAALALLGENSIPTASLADGKQLGLNHADPENPLPAKTQRWMHLNGLALTHLEQVFHLEDSKAELLGGEVPGGNKHEKCRNVYVLVGVAAFVASGEPNFDDKTARVACSASGCYNVDHHSKVLADLGNLFTGSKASGWKLSSPGLNYGAKLIKEMVGSQTE